MARATTKPDKKDPSSSGTYNIYYREKGKKRWTPYGSFDWYTHDKPYASCLNWLQKARKAFPDREYEVRDGDGKKINMGRPPKYDTATKVVSARLNKNHLKVLEVFGKKKYSDGIIYLIEKTNLYKKLIGQEKDEKDRS